MGHFSDAAGFGRKLCILCVGFIVFASSRCCLGWGAQHDDASILAATVAPEPFRSNSKLCRYGSYPDSLPDHAIRSGEEVYLRRLFTAEAIDALRAGDVPKAMLLASAATHFLDDFACIAHSRVWYGTPGDTWSRFLPLKFQAVRVPRVKREVYYPHLKGTAPDQCLDLPEPEVNLDKWRAFQGSINAYFDTMPSVRAHVTPQMLDSFSDWTFNDADQYARWYANFISLDMLDPDTLNGPQMKFGNAAHMTAVCIEELVNGAAQCAAYYGYLSTAAKTEVQAAFLEALPENDKLPKLAAKEPVVVVSAQAPWPVERAAQVLGLELLRAERRVAKAQGRPAPTRKVADYVIRVSPEDVAQKLAGAHAVVLLTPEDAAIAGALQAPAVAPGMAGVISLSRRGDNMTVILRGATRQDALYLVDYLLDLAAAPINAPFPAEPMVEAIKGVWPGWKLLLDLRELKGEEAVAYARKFPKTRPQPSAEDLGKAREQAKRLTERGPGQQEWWDHFILTIPLPDGRKVSDMLEKGTDYSALIKLVTP